VKRSTKNRIITIFLLLIFLVSVAATGLLSTFQSGNQNSATWAAEIIIVINETQYPIPSDLGITGNATTGKFYTGNTNGTIYKTVSGDVKLKDFFDTWNQTFNSTCILSYCNTNTSSMKMYVWDYANSKWAENHDYELYTIKNNDVIMIDYR
jgi:hypothetical protein